MKRLAVDFNFFIRGKLFYKHPLIAQIGNYLASSDKLNRWGAISKTFMIPPTLKGF